MQKNIPKNGEAQGECNWVAYNNIPHNPLWLSRNVSVACLEPLTLNVMPALSDPAEVDRLVCLC